MNGTPVANGPRMSTRSPSTHSILGATGVALLLLGPGCASSPPNAKSPTTAAAPSSASASKSAPSSAEDSPSDAAAASDDSKSGAVAAFPKWKAYGGPKGRFPLSSAYAQPSEDSGLSLWVARPSGTEWDKELSFTLASFERAEHDDYIVKTAIFPEHGYPGDGDLTVPQALVCEPANGAKLKKGDVVLVSMAATTSDYARVIGPEGDDSNTFKIATHWVSADEQVASSSELLRIEDKATCGQRVRFKNAAGDELRWMQLIRVVGDKAWGIGFEEGKYDSVLVSVPAKEITPIPMTKTYAPKSKVMVATGNHTLESGTVEAVVDKGLAYKVKLDDGNESNFDFEDVTDPVPGWPKKE